MNIYSQSDRETLHARKLLKEWLHGGAISAEQYQHLELDTTCDLTTTNLFLRLVLFFFSVLGVVAAAALCNLLFLGHSQTALGIQMLCCGVACYTAAEMVVAGFQLYRHGIEEAFAVCSIAFLYLGLQFAFSSTRTYPPHAIDSVIPAAAALLSLWVWHRFNFWYAFPLAMLFAGFMPDAWSTSHKVQVVATVLLYAMGLIVIAHLRSPRHSNEVRDAPLAEAFLWLGLYLKLNLQLSTFALPMFWVLPSRFIAGRPGHFYWATWVLIWCLPPLILARGLCSKNRFVLAAGAIAAVLTFISNKTYLGWQRHTWDPMLLGLLLAGASLALRRWLEDGPGGVRSGFTAASITGRHEQTLGAATSALSLLSPHSITPAPQPVPQDFHFGGGGSGGGGVTGDF